MAKCTGSLDSNILLRFFTGDVPTQNQTVIKLLKDESAKYKVSDTAIIEVAFVLERAYEYKRKNIAELLRDFSQLVCISIDIKFLDIMLPLYLSSNSLSPEDCALAAYAKIHDALPLYTFDQKLAQKSPYAKLLI